MDHGTPGESFASYVVYHLCISFLINKCNSRKERENTCKRASTVLGVLSWLKVWPFPLLTSSSCSPATCPASPRPPPRDAQRGQPAASPRPTVWSSDFLLCHRSPTPAPLPPSLQVGLRVLLSRDWRNSYVPGKTETSWRRQKVLL